MAVTARTLRLQRQLRRELARITDAQTRDLTRAWVLAWDEIAPDLTDVLLDMLVAGEDITRAQLLRSTRLRGALEVVANVLEGLARQAGIRITADLLEVIATAGSAQASIIDSQLPPNSNLLQDLDYWARVDARQLEAIVRRSTQQITARSRALSGPAYDAVRRELIRGVAAGSNPRVVARRIVARAGDAFDGGLTRAMTIARTEMLDAHRAAAQLGQAEHADLMTGWRWLCDFGPRTCPACLAMHGTLHPIEEAGPDDHPCGRCARLVVVKPWSELGLAVREPADMFPDARGWYSGLPEADQIKIMGRERRDLLASGRIGWEDLATRRKNTGWRDSWQVTPVKDLRVVAGANAA